MEITSRDKGFLIFLFVFLGCFLAYNFMISPIAEKNEINKRKINQKKMELAELKALQSQMTRVKEKASSSKEVFAKRENNFTLFAFLDRVAGNADIKPFINYMKPSSFTDKDTNAQISTVEMKFKDITMQKLFSFLYMVETSENVVSVSKFSIVKQDDNSTKVEAVLLVQAMVF